MTVAKDREVKLESGKPFSRALSVKGLPTDKTLYVACDTRDGSKDTEGRTLGSGFVTLELSPDGEKIWVPYGHAIGSDRHALVHTTVDYNFVRIARKPNPSPTTKDPPHDNYPWTLAVCAADEEEHEGGEAVEPVIFSGSYRLPDHALVDVSVLLDGRKLMVGRLHTSITNGRLDVVQDDGPTSLDCSYRNGILITSAERATLWVRQLGR